MTQPKDFSSWEPISKDDLQEGDIFIFEGEPSSPTYLVGPHNRIFNDLGHLVGYINDLSYLKILINTQSKHNKEFKDKLKELLE